MADPPHFEGKTQQEEDNRLNRFGRWMLALNAILGTTMMEMAKQIGVSKGAISLATHGTSGAKRETVLLLAERYRQLAESQGIVLPVAWELFFSVSWFDSAEVIGGADQALEALEDRAVIVKERDKLERGMEKERTRKEELARENQILRQENRALKREIERIRGMRGKF